MKANKKFAFTVAACLASLGGATYMVPVSAQLVVVDPTNYVANSMTQLRAVQSNLNEAKQIQQQLEALRYQAQNTRSLTQGAWSQGADTIARLANVLQEGSSLAVTAKDYARQFHTMFPGYKADHDVSRSYDRWNATTRDSVLGALKVANLQANGYRDEQQALLALKHAVGSTNGQKEALDAANHVALAQVTQMQSLRELMVAQMQAEGTYMAAQTQAAHSREESIRDATQYRDTRSGFKPKPIKIGN
ncbi:P-type conjugative transfer protein TrbJ [Stenotrophomonas sp. NPDC078853]|uniref:P-type conjugative transfer protein TrbJ n=1 Tax=Stenotrophomonas sp. NPDC078853 TaxID=3364534 RepID=UPI00384FCB03